MKNLVVGAGVSGAAIANLIADKLGEQVLVIDRKNHIALVDTDTGMNRGGMF